MRYLTLNGVVCQIIPTKYAIGGRTCIQLFDYKEKEPYATATINMDGLDKDEIAIKDYSENIGVLRGLLDAQVVYPPHRHVVSGFAYIPICHLTKEFIEEEM